MRALTAEDYDRARAGDVEPFELPLPTEQAALDARARAYTEGRLTRGEDPEIARAAERYAEENERQRRAHELEAHERGVRLGLIQAEPSLGDGASPEDVNRAPETEEPVRWGAKGSNIIGGSGVLDPNALLGGGLLGTRSETPIEAAPEPPIEAAPDLTPKG